MQDPALADTSLLSPGSTPIAQAEPVCLFRAQDKHFIGVLTSYAVLLEDDPATTPGMLASVNAHIELATAWQALNGSKTPDLAEVGA